MLSAITLCLICVAIPLLCHLLNIFSLSTKEKACEALILLQVVQAGRREAKSICVPFWRSPGKQSTHGGRDRGGCDGLGGGEPLQGNEAQLKLPDTTIKVMMHSLLLTCLKFCLICDHNSLQLLEVSLQQQPVERQQLMQGIFVVICSPKKYCQYFLTAKISWDSIRCLNTCPSTSSSAEAVELF